MSNLLMPVRRRSDRVDIPGQGWQSLTWPPAAVAAEKQAGVTEVVLKGVIKEADGKRRNVVLFTDQAIVRQTVRMKSCTAEQGEKTEKDGLTAAQGQTPGADVWRGKDVARPGQAEHSEPAQIPGEKDGRGRAPGGSKVTRGKSVTRIKQVIYSLQVEQFDR